MTGIGWGGIGWCGGGGTGGTCLPGGNGEPYCTRCKRFGSDGHGRCWGCGTGFKAGTQAGFPQPLSEDVCYKPELKLTGNVLHATSWAHEFWRLWEYRLNDLSEDTMLCWFANAIVTGHDIGRQRLKDQLREIWAKRAAEYRRYSAEYYFGYVDALHNVMEDLSL